MSDKNPTIFRLKPKEINISAEDIGIRLVSDDADKQAAIFSWAAKEVESWGSGHSWPQQCRAIAESMTNEQCFAVRHILDSLLEHLEAIPQERRSKEVAKECCDTDPIHPTKENEHGRDG